jgi:signal peptidase I
MAKTQNPPAKPDRAKDADRGAKKNEPAAGKTDAKKKPKPSRSDNRRETIESIVVAFILAFLFRTFEAEAFVIPTGSMAPTLYGRHKDITCEKCGHHYAIGASDEVESPGFLIPGNLVEDAICPNCRYTTPKDVVQKLPVFKGDRILVNKFPYEFGEPQRFDVVVFKYPEEPQTNYIKRLVGLPGDKLEIRQGDVYTETKNGVVILRKKDPNKQKRLQILVYDNEHPPHDLLKTGWPERWAALKRTKAADTGWSQDAGGWTANGRTFTLESSATGNGNPRWIRYQHFVPTQKDWVTALSGGRPQKLSPELITDFCGYNAYTGGQYGQYVDYGQYWVGDLTINCDVSVEELGTNPELVFELVEGFRTYRCRFNLETGECTIGHNRDDSGPGQREELVLATAGTKLKGTGKHRVSFANVDDRLSVWVDGKLVDFGTKDDGVPRTHYAPLGGPASYQAPSKDDLAPVGIAGRNCGATVSKLLVQRDIYYRAEHVATPAAEYRNRAGNTYEYIGEPIGPGQTTLTDQAEFTVLNSLKHDPEAWWKQYSGGEELGSDGKFRRYRHLRPAKFPRLGPDEFFMMGDNSPRSKDSRLWPNENRPGEPRYVVKREALVGKAFFTYWPHGVPFLNDGKGIPVFYHTTVAGEKTDYPSFRVPFYPNFWRMKRIR